MKSEKEWDQEILRIITTIRQKYPELTKYINEMPVNNSKTDEISTQTLEDYYNSLEELISNYANKGAKGVRKVNKDDQKSTPPGYPSYPSSDDIYKQDKEEAHLNPEDTSKSKSPNEKSNEWNEKNFKDDMSGGDLDVPGSELDDAEEIIGNEDEENNHYSLGGDNHNDLEEDKG